MLKLAAAIILVWQPLLGAATPFNFARGLIEVQATINDSIKAILAIDTGADDIYLDLQFAVERRLIDRSTKEIRPVTGVAGQSRALGIELNSISLCDIERRCVPASVVDMKQFIADQSQGFPDGVVGAKFLSGYKIAVNYPDKKLSLIPADSGGISLDGYSPVPFRKQAHLIIVDATYDDSLKASLILDLAATYTSLSSDLIDAWNVKTADSEAVFILDKIALSDSVARNGVMCLQRDHSPLKARLGGGEFQGTLGTSFLNSFSLLIDYQNQIIYFKRM